MVLTLQFTNAKDLFRKYLLSLNFLLHLKEDGSEIPLMSAYLVLFNQYKLYDRSKFYELLWSDSTTEMIKKNLGISEKSHKKAHEGLVSKGLIVDNKINDKLLYSILKNDFKVVIEFKQEKK